MANYPTSESEWNRIYIHVLILYSVYKKQRFRKSTAKSTESGKMRSFIFLLFVNEITVHIILRKRDTANRRFPTREVDRRNGICDLHIGIQYYWPVEPCWSFASIWDYLIMLNHHDANASRRTTWVFSCPIAKEICRMASIAKDEFMSDKSMDGGRPSEVSHEMVGDISWIG